MPVISCSFSPLLPFPLSPSILLAMLALPRRGDQSSKTTEVTARQQRRGSSPKPRSSGRECRPSLVPSKEDTSHGDARAVTYVDSTEHDNRQPRHRPPPSFSPVVSLGVTPVPPPDVKDSSVLFSLSQYDSSPTIKLPFPSPFLISRFRPSSAFVYSPPLSQRSRLSRHRSFFSFFSSCAPFSALSSRSVHMKADHRNGMASSSSEEFPKAPPGTFLCMHLSSSPCSLPSLSIEDRSDDHRTNNRLHSSPTQSTPDSTTPTKRKSSASPVLTRQNSSLIWPRHLPEKKTDSSKHPGHSARLLSQSPQPHAVEGSQASASILSARLRGRKTSSPSGRRRPVSALRAKELGTPRKKIPTRCSSLSSPPGSSSSSPTTTSPSVLFRTVKSTPPLPSSPSDSPSGLFGPVLGVQFSPTILVPHTCSADERSTPHDCVGVAPRCMHDLCWIPAARAYAIGVYIHRDTLRQWKRLYAEGAANNQKADPQVTQHQVTGTSTSKEKDSRKHEEDHVALLFSPDVEKTLVFTFVNDKDPAHILRGFERALQSTAPRALVGLEKGTRLLLSGRGRTGAELSYTAACLSQKLR